MSKERSFIKDVIVVALSNIIVLLSSIITGFVVPNLLGVVQYGIFKVFSLYLVYVPLMHLGFVDGILITYAGKEYDGLDKAKFRMYTKFFARIEAIIASIVICIALLFVNEESKLIISLVGVDLFLINLTSYYQYVSQSTSRFKELSLRKIWLALLKTLLVIVLYVFGKYQIIFSISAIVYIIGLIVIDGLLLGWYLWTYKDITFGSADKINYLGILNLFKIGIVITIAYQISQIIFAIDRQFVSIIFDIETYSVYSFAYNLITVASTAINAVALVLFPKLKKMTQGEIVNSFEKSISYILLVSFAAIGCYPILCLFIKLMLPAYVESAQYLLVLFPGMAISASINIIMFTYFKSLDKQGVYCLIGCVVLCAASLLNWIANIIFNTPTAISVASIITLLIWYMLCQIYFSRKYKVNYLKNLIYILLSSSCFYVSVYWLSGVIFPMITYYSLFIGLSIFLFPAELKYVFSKFLIKKSK